MNIDRVVNQLQRLSSPNWIRTIIVGEFSLCYCYCWMKVKMSWEVRKIRTDRWSLALNPRLYVPGYHTKGKRDEEKVLKKVVATEMYIWNAGACQFSYCEPKILLRRNLVFINIHQNIVFLQHRWDTIQHNDVNYVENSSDLCVVYAHLNHASSSMFIYLHKNPHKSLNCFVYSNK